MSADLIRRLAAAGAPIEAIAIAIEALELVEFGAHSARVDGAARVRLMMASGMTGEQIADAIDALENPPLIDRLRGNAWMAVRRRIFERDNWTCQYCGKGEREDVGALHCDHVVPVSRGGGNADDNLTTACAPCNMAKGAKTPAEWLQ